MIQKKSSDSPLYLSLLIQHLVMINKNDFDDITAHGDGMTAITAHQLELVDQSGFFALYQVYEKLFPSS